MKSLVLALFYTLLTFTYSQLELCAAASSISTYSLSVNSSILSSSSTIPSSSSTILSSSSTSDLFTSSNPITTTATTTSTVVLPEPTQPVNASTLNDIEVIHERRLSSIVGSVSGASSISSWLSTLGSNGQWPASEVDYTTGCDAQRANWPAQTHWQRLQTMAAAWNGGLAGASEFVKSDTLRAAISLAMNFWFINDFTDPSCLDSGGDPACPCGTPGFWNTNWFSNIILIPKLVGATCLLLNDTLASTELGNCTHITGRAYGTFGHSINGAGFLTGANTLDLATAGIDQGLLNVNVSLITDAYSRVHAEVVVEQALMADGIRPDGSFGQHVGIIYNGNYGKDYLNDILNLEVEAGGTEFAASGDSRSAVNILFEGDKWMIFRNTLTGVLHWDFSVLGRFISFPVIDSQATGSINLNLTQVEQLGELWNSSTLIDFANDLSENTTTANAGELIGNRAFFDNDYLVQRGRNYVTTVRMYSSRTKNTECTNSQNPLGFHLADGVIYTYLAGNEYEDISASWDWNLIPGITVDYAATPLSCGNTGFTGIEAFVGSVSNGDIGAAAMRYTNPLTSFHFQKAWFFLEDDVQLVMVSDITSSTSAPIYSILDQKRHNGDILVNGVATQTSNTTGVATLWHDFVGYAFNIGDNLTLSVQVGNKTGSWQTIGTSTQPPETVDLFAAWIDHTSLNTSISYMAYPGTNSLAFQVKHEQSQVQIIQNDADLSAVYDGATSTAMVVFWDVAGGSVSYVPSPRDAAITITSDGNIALIYCAQSGNITVSDPSQQLTSVNVTLNLGQGRKPARWGTGRTKNFTFILPTSGLAASSVTQNTQCYS